MNRLGFHCIRLRHIEEGILENELRRGEFYHFPEEELPALKRELLRHELAMSIHTPMLCPEWYPEPPTISFLCDVDRENRKLTMRMIVETMAQAEDFGAEYVVVHFPTPATDAAGESTSKLEAIAHGSCDWLAELSEKYHIPIHIEGMGVSPLLNSEFLSQVLSEYPPLRYCFDSGHMQLASQGAGFDLYQSAEGIAPFVGSVHLWNTRGRDDYQTFRHIPVHPAQKPEEGWADIARLLKSFGAAPRSVIFESPRNYPEELGSYDYRDGVKWVKELLTTSP